MPISSVVITKSVAAFLAIGLGTLGGFNYVNGGFSLSTGDEFSTVPAQYSISSVSAPLSDDLDPSTPELVTDDSSQDAQVASLDEILPSDSPETSDKSSGTSTDRDGILTGATQTEPTQSEESIAVETSAVEG